MRKLIIFIFCLLIVNLHSQTVDIGLFYNSKIKNFTFTVIKGEYKIVHKERNKGILVVGDIIYITLIEDYVQVRNSEKLIGTFSALEIVGQDKDNAFSLNLLFSDIKPRQYDDDLHFKIKSRHLELINHVLFEKYIAGVVEAETGSTSELEFYKAQALICRTYAYQNKYRHGEEGFNLCDGVHCQAYKGSSYFSELIPKAAYTTKNLIIVDTANRPINAAFHSNSGGYTANSEDVWVSEKYYLRSIEDPYSLNGKNTNWKTSISLADWKNYLRGQGYRGADQISINSFESVNKKRRNYLNFGLETISYKKIRADFDLRSAYFSIVLKSDSLLFIGKGYGHGVGLSQEGGMEMARQGKTYEDIIHFYYNNVKIINSKDINGKEE